MERATEPSMRHRLLDRVMIDWSTVPLGEPTTDLTPELLAAPCWRWTGAAERNGLGRVKIGGRNRLARRVMYETFVGAIPAGKVLGQRCPNKWCVNFAHLEPITTWEAMAAHPTVAARNGAKTRCPQGHEYDAENTAYRLVGRSMGRSCRACDRGRTRARRKAGRRIEAWR